MPLNHCPRAGVQVQVLVEGTYPILAVNLPRHRDELFLKCMDQATAE
jgi:hypothetical protein